MGEEISARLTTLRKHLGDRLGEKLSMELVAERSHITEQQVYRLEHGLNGTTVSLLSLLQFYSSNGYNLNWIINADNSRASMMISNGNQLQQIGELILQISQGLASGHANLNALLREIGYIPLEESHKTPVESDVQEAVGVTL